jgi:DhnA family fructose-bisphosphate aldolase class Ia
MLGRLAETRAVNPEAIYAAAARRPRRPLLGDSGRLLLIAADHPARGALSAGTDPLAMANRYDLLDRLSIALSRPGVDGVLATPDIVEDLLLLGVLDEKVIIGSMNRGGLRGADFEMDDRFTGYDAEWIQSMGLEGGKMLLRIDLTSSGSLDTLHACSAAVTALARQHTMAMIEPFMTRRVDGAYHHDLSTEAVVRSVGIAMGLGATSAHTWLKVPVVPDMERVVASTTSPIVLLGGESAKDPDAMFSSWEKALRLPGVRGLAVGRNLLYPADDDVAANVDIAVGLL